MQGFYKIMGKLMTHRPFVNMLCKTKDYEQVVFCITRSSGFRIGHLRMPFFIVSIKAFFDFLHNRISQRHRPKTNQ